MLRQVGLVVVLSAVPLSVGAEGFALGFKVGSTGLGAEATVRLASKLNARVGGSAFRYNYDGELSEVDYALALKLKGGSAAFDFHPAGGPFRVSLGLLVHGNTLSGAAAPPRAVRLGGHSYDPSEIGVLSVNARYRQRVAPFATIGLGNGARGSRLFLSFEGGVALTRSPVVTIGATGHPPGLDADLRIEEQNVNDDLGVLKLYPILSLVVGFRL